MILAFQIQVQQRVFVLLSIERNRRVVMKKDILLLLQRELSEGPGFLDKTTISELISKLEGDTLTDQERRLIADHVLANYLGLGNENVQKRDDEIEEMIDWILGYNQE